MRLLLEGVYLLHIAPDLFYLLLTLASILVGGRFGTRDRSVELLLAFGGLRL